MTTAIKVILIVCLPLVAFTSGVRLMSKLSNHGHVMQRVLQLPHAEDRVPLNKRLRGYDSDAVARYWGALDVTALEEERSLLKLDLLFPLLYGSALLTSLLLAWGAVGRPFSFYWLLAPVAITILADWTENTLQLAQLRRFMAGNAIEPLCIRIASAATVTKLLTIWVILLVISLLTVWMLGKAMTSVGDHRKL